MGVVSPPHHIFQLNSCIITNRFLPLLEYLNIGTGSNQKQVPVIREYKGGEGGEPYPNNAPQKLIYRQFQSSETVIAVSTLKTRTVLATGHFPSRAPGRPFSGPVVTPNPHGRRPASAPSSALLYSTPMTVKARRPCGVPARTRFSVSFGGSIGIRLAPSRVAFRSDWLSFLFKKKMYGAMSRGTRLWNSGL